MAATATATGSKAKLALSLTGKTINESLSFVIFSILDLLDFILCFLFKVADFFFEAEWRPCYCSSGKEAIISSGKILVSEKRESRIVCLNSSKLHLEEVSDTLYTRPSFASEVSGRFKFEGSLLQSSNKLNRGSTMRSGFIVNSTIVEMLQGKFGGKQQQWQPSPRWSDCDCKTCTSWMASAKKSLFVRIDGAKDNAQEDVLFIHGFISSSSFWTETLFPNFSAAAKSTYRLFAIDLLGFGRSPKPTDSLYTLRDHLDMIEKSVLEPYKVKSFHIVAHSLGCILALALAVKHPGTVKSLTLLAPPYFPAPKGEQSAQYVMRRVAPRRVWPPIALGASIACWYEHISRAVCLLVCKNHRFWEFLTKLLSRNRMKTYLLEGFFSHTHNAAWHTLHNIICGAAGKIDTYLDIVRNHQTCQVNIFHGRDDELIPVECSHVLRSRLPGARLRLIEHKDHITIVVGRPKAFARELEEIWSESS